MRKLILILLLTVSLFALNEKQIETLQVVRDVARMVPDKTGETFEDTLSAICLTESSAGLSLLGDFTENTPVTKASLGAMQVQSRTARFMGRKYKQLDWITEMSGPKLANKLISNLRFSALVASYYMKWLSDTRKTYYSAVSGYNGGKDNWKYYSKVKKNMKIVRGLVKRGILR